LRFLHRAGELLGGSLDFEQTLRRVAQLAVPDIADWCGVYAISEDGPPREVTSVHPDPEVEALIVDIRRRRRRGETGSESLEVMRSRRSVLATDITRNLAPDVADAERAVVERLGPRSYMIVPLIARGRVLGAMTLLSAREGRHYTDEDLQFAETVGAHCALVIDNARLYDAAEQSVGLLDTFFAIAPVGLGFVDNDLRYVRVNDAFAGFSDRPAAEHIGRTAREVLDAELGDRVAGLHRRVLDSGEPLLDVELTDGQRSWSASYTPVRGLDGQVIGLGIVLVDVTERRRLLEVERDARLRADFLARAGAILDESLVYEETLGNVARIAVPDIADWCLVSILDRDGMLNEVARHHTDPAKLAIARELTDRFPTPMNAPGGPPKVARTGVTEFIPEITDEMLEAGLRDPEHLRLVRALGLRSVIIAPLHARGRTFGTFTLAHAESGRRFDAADVQLAEELAHRAGQAIENARLYTERARIAHLLQVKLLPERLPEIPGARVAARYRAAGELNEVGGDFYDVFARSPSEWALVVGDVSGKGAEAAAITALARYTLRAAALEAGPPSVALQRLNQAMLAHDDSSQFATVVLAYAAAGAGGGMDVRLALGGHPPPLVLRADGSVEAPGAFGTILGATPDAVLTDVEVRIAAGDVLVLYTDGVTEAGARTRPLGQEGLARLLQSLAGEPPEDVVGAVEHAVVEAQPGEPRDDIAVVALSVAAQ
jgi:serine phosphatase RsbU (regulator of sigma subunit)/PAS domain-containing protein